jgi:DNA processing protein
VTSAMPSVSEEERLARLALNVVSEPADPRYARLLQTMGPVELFDRLCAETDPAGLRSESSSRLVGLEPARLLEEAAGRGIRFLVPGDEEWPRRLDDLAAVDPLNGLSGTPLGLWVKGPLSLTRATRRSVALVGSRSATSYGTSMAGNLAAAVCGQGFTVVSGAAFGIDQAAHRGALGAAGPTIAVLACGVDRAYPSAHRDLLTYLAEHGAVVSELPPGSAPTRIRFLGRNRLIAALTLGTVVVEAAVRSGALNTAAWAGRLNRVVMGVPGPVTSAPSEGVHELVRSGAATLVTRGEHVLELVAPSGKHLVHAPRSRVTARDRLGSVDARVLEAVPLVQSAPASSIARTAGTSPTATRASLTVLRDQGWVVADEGLWRRAPTTPDEE